MSASSNTTTGALPPSSRWHRLRLCAAAVATSIPARTEPVTLTIAGVGMHDHRPAGVAVTADDVSTPAGRNSAAISASSVVEAGVVSLGLSTTVLPAAIAGANFQIAIIIG